MIYFLRSRRQGRKIARKVRELLDDERVMWEVKPAASPGAVLHLKLDYSLIAVVIECKRLRFLDSVHLYVDGADVYVPLIARIRLRGAARCRMQEIAELRTRKK